MQEITIQQKIELMTLATKIGIEVGSISTNIEDTIKNFNTMLEVITANKSGEQVLIEYKAGGLIPLIQNSIQVINSQIEMLDKATIEELQRRS